MAKKESIESTVTIQKEKSYLNHTVILPIDAERTEKFNRGEAIEVTQEELKTIKGRWLEVKNVS